MSNKVEEIPSDEVIKMTKLFHKAFNALGCNPMCHCCEEMIPIGNNFKLSTILEAPQKWGECAYFQKEILLGNQSASLEDYISFFKYEIRDQYKDSDTNKCKENAERYKLISKEVMLCEKCTPKTFMLKELDDLEKEIKRMEKPKGGCFRVNGKIIH